MPGQERCEKQCKELAGDNVLFLGHIDYNDPLLAAAFAAAKVFALPSYSEVMPQVLYQAIQAGCNVVVSRNVPIYDEIKDKVFRFNPSNIKQLRDCICKAHARPVSDDLREFGMRMPGWRQVTDRICRIYEKYISR